MLTTALVNSDVICSLYLAFPQLLTHVTVCVLIIACIKVSVPSCIVLKTFPILLVQFL